MFNWIKGKIDVFLLNEQIPEEDIPIIKYGLVQGMKSLLGFLLSIMLGWLLGIPLLSIFFLVGFMSLRVYAGGFHAKSEKKCAVLSAITVLAAYVLIKSNIENILLVLIPGAIAMVVICVLSPVENPDNLLSATEKRYFKKWAVAISVFIWIISVAALYFGFLPAARCMEAVLLLVALNVFVGFVAYKKSIPAAV